MTRWRRPLLNYYRYRGARFKPLRHPASGISSKPIDYEKISQHIGSCQEKKSIYGILYLSLFFLPQLNLTAMPSARPHRDSPFKRSLVGP